MLFSSLSGAFVIVFAFVSGSRPSFPSSIVRRPSSSLFLLHLVAVVPWAKRGDLYQPWAGKKQSPRHASARSARWWTKNVVH